jgi:hypothetical protein
MGQLYMQRFEYRGGIARAELDEAWGKANVAMATTGNWGGVKNGITHIHGYGTAWGGYALIEVEDPQALVEYQLFHVNNYSHLVKVSIEPLVDVDVAFEPAYAEIRANG